MKIRHKISMIDLCSKLKRDIPRILNLAKSGKFPLWVQLEDVDVYEQGIDGKFQVANIKHPVIVMPTSEVLEALMLAEGTSQEISGKDDGLTWEVSLSEFGKMYASEKVEETQLQRWGATNFETFYKIFPGKVLSYNALPAITEEGESIIIKQCATLHIRKEEKDYSVHYFLDLKSSDLFAYKEDVTEFERSLAEDYYIGREKLLNVFECKSFNTVVNKVKTARIKLEYTDEPHPRPMLKKMDYLKLK